MTPWIIAFLGSLGALGTVGGLAGLPIVAGLAGAVSSGLAAWVARRTIDESSLWVVAWSAGWAVAALIRQLNTLFSNLGIVSLLGALLALPIITPVIFLVGWGIGVAPRLLLKTGWRVWARQ